MKNIILAGVGGQGLVLATKIIEIRRITFEVLAQKKQQAFSLVEFEVRNISSLALAYNLYEEEFIEFDGIEERAAEIKILNPIQSSLRMNGEVEVFVA